MKTPEQKIFNLSEIENQSNQWKSLGKIAFTNGVYDLIHEGHIFSLMRARSEADFLIVGVNSDASVRRLKGPERPVQNQKTRSIILAALMMIDAVVIFEPDTPLELIKLIKPDVLVKGGDYTMEQIAGAPEVTSYGGRVVIHPILENFSTSSTIMKLKREQ